MREDWKSLLKEMDKIVSNTIRKASFDGTDIYVCDEGIQKTEGAVDLHLCALQPRPKCEKWTMDGAKPIERVKVVKWFSAGSDDLPTPKRARTEAQDTTETPMDYYFAKYATILELNKKAQGSKDLPPCNNAPSDMMI